MDKTNRPEWPKHPNGKQKRMGEMTRAEQEAQLKHICAELQDEFNCPSSAFQRLISGDRR